MTKPGEIIGLCLRCFAIRVDMSCTESFYIHFSDEQIDVVIQLPVFFGEFLMDFVTIKWISIFLYAHIFNSSITSRKCFVSDVIPLIRDEDYLLIG